MHELLPELENWLNKGEPVALATVVSTWGSAPRPAGSYMAISQAGGLVGSVSGGCVEGAVIQAAQKVMEKGQPCLLHFGVADETAWNVGLACGGEIDIFVQPANQKLFKELLPRLKADQGLILATVIKGNEKELGAQTLTAEEGNILVSTSPMPQFELSNGNEPKILEIRTGQELFINPLRPSPTLIMIGGVHIAVALAKLARALNFRTVVIDPRKAFGTTERFADTDKLIKAWPKAAFEQLPITSSTAIASLSHDPKIDDPALEIALKSPAFYVGALGSKGTQARRRKRLLDAGVSENEFERLHGPIGIQIGALTPEEIALAIMAEVIAAFRN